MIKNATEMWGVHSSDLASFDPIVDLLFGACSVELERVYQEIHSSNARVLERLSKLLLPDVYKNTTPAHSVMYVRPYQNNLLLNKYYQFAYVKKTQAKESSIRENQKEIFLSPAKDINLIKARVVTVGTNTGLYSIDNLLYKDRICDVMTDKSTKFLWVGLEIDDSISTYEDIVLYFDWLNDPRKEKFLEYLPFTSWSINNMFLRYEIGLGNSYKVSTEDTFNNDNEMVVCQNVIEYYSKRYITLRTSDYFKDKGEEHLVTYPDEFTNLYHSTHLKKLNKKLLWIKGTFPPFFSNENIDDMICQINAVPVISRKMNELNFRILPETLNIVPLRDRSTDESFFNIESVKSSDGKSYISTNITELNELKNGSFVVRKGGVQRFDQRSAREYLNYMIDLIRDESAAFSVFGQEMLFTDITMLQQTLSRIEQKVTPAAEQHTTDYLILKSYLKEDNVYIEYWSTAGEIANGISPGTELTLFRGDDVDAGSLRIMSKSTGGKDELTASEMLRTFKMALTSREHIISIADIKSLCYSEMGSLISDVKVSKTFVVDSEKRTGFKRIVKVEIAPATRDIMDDNEWSMYKLQIETKLKNLSFSNIPIELVLIAI